MLKVLLTRERRFDGYRLLKYIRQHVKYIMQKYLNLNFYLNIQLGATFAVTCYGRSELGNSFYFFNNFSVTACWQLILYFFVKQKLKFLHQSKNFLDLAT